MKSQMEIYERIEKLIPAHLAQLTSHLSFAEMAERPDCEQWKHELLQAERDWFLADH